MARVFTDGAEFGDAIFFEVKTIAASSSVKRSGAYSYAGNQAYGQKNITGLSELYFRAAWLPSTNGPGTGNIFELRNSTTAHAYVRFNASAGVFEVYSAGTLRFSSTFPAVQGTWYLIEAYLKIDDSTGVLTVKIDGVQIGTYTGDTRNGASTTVNNIYLNGSPGSSITWAFDDLALNDTTGGADNSWCGDGRVILLKPNGNGDASDLTGSDGNSTDNYLLVDEIPSDGDTTYVEGSTSGNRDLYAIEDFSGTGKTIKRVWVEARARDTVAAGGQCKLSVKPSGGSEDKSSAINLLTSYTRIIGTDYTTNPADSGAWEDGDLDALQIGFEVV